MMRKESFFSLYQNETLQMLELPYENRDLSMLVVLPRKVDGLGDVETSVDIAMLEQWRKAMKRQNVLVNLPKFKMTSQFSLRKVLTAMGMGLAFSDKADFSGMSTRESLCISAVIHKAFVDVNEQGTEAAAATAVLIAPTSAPIVTTPVPFIADHPFLFLICDNRTGSILFMGRVADPSNTK